MGIGYECGRDPRPETAERIARRKATIDSMLEQQQEEQRSYNRHRLHSFGLAGGRR